MYAKLFKAAKALSILLGVLLAGPDLAISGQPLHGGQPLHAVRGHAIYNLDPPRLIEQITINASVDGSGAVIGSVAVFPSSYLAPPNPQAPDLAGWTWVIRPYALSVGGNVAQMEGKIVFDNRLPDVYIGCRIGFIVRDNGSGAWGRPDELEIYGECGIGSDSHPILGGNFNVK